MKNIALVMVNAVLGILTLLIVMTMYGRINRSMELSSNLASAAEETIETMALTKKYSIHNTNEFLADLVSELSVLLDSESDITVHILQCDKERGILSLRVVLSYLHPNGKEGTVSCEKTVLVNKTPKPEKVPVYRILFKTGADLYKEYTVEEGSVICAPAAPQETGYEFWGWVDENGNPADFTQPVGKEQTYHADMRKK